MAITAGNSTYVSGSSGGTTSSMDTTGASLLVASIAYTGNGSGNISDSKGNTWTALTKYVPTSNDRSEILFYAANPTVGTGHTFTTTNTVSTLIVSAFNGVKTSSPFDVENGGVSFSATTQSTGNVTPSEDNELLVTGSQNGSVGTQSVSAGFTTIRNILLSAGTYYGCAMAYKVQTTATTEGATWSFSTNTTSACSIATFKQAPVSTTTNKKYSMVFG